LKTNYYVSGSTIIAEERLNANGGVETFIYYIYDTSGIAGLFVNNAYYYFTKNLFGDIIGIKNAANELVGAYTYDAWGKCTVKTNIDGIATLNPFRYRGYYYDTETGFYYLQTRYYDPEICRFISADDPEILGDLASVVGQLNLYAYCLNNPVMYTDETGYAVETVFDIISLGFSIADVIVNPLDLWAWAGLAGDLVDLIPFVTGVGETIKAGKGLRFLLAHADEGASLFKNADNIVDFAKGADKVLDAGSDIVRTGQKHHVITRRIADRISELGWNISRNDYIVQALTPGAHRGFQKWHREYQREILEFLSKSDVTEIGFKKYVNSLYAAPEMIERFGIYVPFIL